MLQALDPQPRAASAARYQPVSYEAFRVCDVSADPKKPKWRTYPLTPPASPPASLVEAAELAKVHCFHKDRLAIRETNAETGAATMHLYAVKRQSAPQYVYRDHAYVRTHPLYIEPVCSVELASAS